MKILIFDTETTGLPVKNSSIYDKCNWPYIIQLSFIYYDLSNNHLLVYDNYINIDDSIEIPEESYNIHKISKETLSEKGINIIDALNEFNLYLKLCDVVVGHNISFDKRMVFVECFRNNIKQNFTIFNGKTKICKSEYCTMLKGKELCNIVRLNKTNKTYLKNPSLIELYQKLFPDCIIPKNLHNSLVDILITMRCYIKMNYNLNITDINNEIQNLFIKFEIL